MRFEERAGDGHYRCWVCREKLHWWWWQCRKSNCSYWDMSLAPELPVLEDDKRAGRMIQSSKTRLFD